MGFLKKDGGGDEWVIPIYGVEDMNFLHETTFETDTSIANPLILQWKGDKPVKFNFKFKLVAGVTAISRRKLFSYVRTAHALNAGTYRQGSAAAPPPPCLFALGDYVLCKGVVLDISVNVQGPWANDAGFDVDDDIVSMNPTIATFSGEFLAVNSWTSNGEQIVNIDQQRFSSNDIKKNFYRT
jgi:hypothetical protein